MPEALKTIEIAQRADTSAGRRTWSPVSLSSTILANGTAGVSAVGSLLDGGLDTMTRDRYWVLKRFSAQGCLEASVSVPGGAFGLAPQLDGGVLISGASQSLWSMGAALNSTDGHVLFVSPYVVAHDGGVVCLDSNRTVVRLRGGGILRVAPTQDGQGNLVRVEGQPGWPMVLERSLDLRIWQVVGTNATPKVRFDYPAMGEGFYKARALR